jgi:hypothetical protein
MFIMCRIMVCRITIMMIGCVDYDSMIGCRPNRENVILRVKHV